jgi:cytochrome c-type biogenesis protein CcmF
LFAPVSREAALVVNNLLLSCAAAAVFIGTLYPLALEALTGDKISVGPPYYHLTFLPIIVPLLILAPLGPMLSWKRADTWAALQRLWAAALLSIALAFFLGALKNRGASLAPLGIALGLWLVFGSFAEFVERSGLGRVPLSSAWVRLAGLPRSGFGMITAHLGLGLAIIGIVAVTAWRQEIVTTLNPGDRVDIAGYSVTYIGEAPVTGPNYTAESTLFRIMTPGGRDKGNLVSERRRFAPGGQITTEAGILSLWPGDLYVVMGDAAPEGGRVVRLYFNPLVSFIWLGAAVMFSGGLLSLSDRRLRIGAPRRGRALSPTPAE